MRLKLCISKGFEMLYTVKQAVVHHKIFDFLRCI